MQEKGKKMIQNETVMTVADNSGARKAMCIKVLGGSHRRYATVGDKIVVAIKEAIPRGKVQKGTVQRAIIVQPQLYHFLYSTAAASIGRHFL